MKDLRLIITWLLIVAIAPTLFSQSPNKSEAENKVGWNCLSQINFDTDSIVRQNYEQQMNKFKNAGQVNAEKGMAGLKRIPVVVHMLYDAANVNNPAVNISYNQIQWQIAALNTAFQKDYPAYTNNLIANGPFAVDTKIQFCLATIPMGTNSFAANEPGVVRYQVPSNILNHPFSTIGQNQLLNITHGSVGNFPFDKYLNIWLVSNIVDPFTLVPMAIGYGTFPNGSGLDGIVMVRDVFGDNTLPYTGSILIQQLDKGRILAHEAGHYLNLLHTFSGVCAGDNDFNCASSGDLICDTPPSVINFAGPCSGPNTCFDNLSIYGNANQLDMLENFMSYSDDDCMNTFTNGQSAVMNGVLNTAWPLGRLDMTTPPNLTATGLSNNMNCCPTGALSAGFSYTYSCLNIAFTNLMPSCNINATYAWDFGDGNTSTSINPFHTYSSPGPYIASCTVTAANGTTSQYSTAVSAYPTSTLLAQSGNQLVCNNSEQSIYIEFGPNVSSVQLTDGTNTVTLNNLCPTCTTNIGVYTFTVTGNVTYSLLPGFCGNFNTASFTVTDCCSNLVVNGDFEAGNTAFNSELLYNGSIFGSYYVVDPTILNDNVFDYEFNGLASYSGVSLMCDGWSGNNGIINITQGSNTGQEGKIWEQTINGLQPNTTYYASMKITRNNYYGYTYIIGGNLEYRMSIYNANSTLWNSPVITQPLIDNWYGLNFTVFNYTFTTPAIVNSTYSFTIYQENNFYGNFYDYMIDNILLQPFNNVNITANNSATLCIGEPLTLTASGATSYTWYPGMQNTPSIVITPSVPTVYTLLSDAATGGCQSYDHFTVTPYMCCTVSPTNIYAYDNYTFTTNTNISGPYAFISGTTVINPGVQVSINNTEIVMQPDARILLKPAATLTVNTSWFHSCTDMWDGIYLLDATRLKILGSFIEDAKRAIVDTMGAAEIRSGDNIFNRNRVGIHLKRPITTTNILFDQSIFTTSNLNISYPINPSYLNYFQGTLSNISAAPAQLLRAPYNTIYGQYGIVLDTTSWAGGTKINIYGVKTDKVYQGILSRLSKANIFTSSFRNHEIGLHPLGDPCGVYVIGSNAPLYQTASEVTVGGMGTGFECYFINNRFGVYNRNSSNLDILKSDFYGHELGIVVTTNSSNKTVNILRNKFSKTQFGIDLYDNVWIDAYVNENRLDNSPTPLGNATNNLAIMAIEVTAPSASPVNYASYQIYNNYINQYYSGIFVSTTYQTDVSENEVHLVPDNNSANMQRGIHFENTANISVKSNLVDKPNPDYSAFWQMGIFGDNNIEPVVSCNEIRNMYTSIKMQLPNITPLAGSGIVLNRMINSRHGFWLDNNGDIGTQFISGSFNTGNQWTNMITSKTYVTNASNSLLSLFYSPSVGPNVLNMAINAGGFAALGPQFGNPNSTFVCGAAIPTPSRPGAKESALAKYYTADENVNMASNRSRMLLRDLKAGSLVGKEVNVNLQKAMQKNTISTESLFYGVDSLIQLARLSVNTGLLNEARVINQNISSTCKAEENQKWLNALYIESQEKPLLESEIKLIEELAVKCPENDGLAVYQARSILSGITRKLYSSTCEQKTIPENILAQITELDMKFEITLYPNPASKEVYVEYPKTTKNATATLTLFNNLGEIITTYKLTEGKTNLNINTLPVGIYMCRITLNNGESETHKLIINK